ncbi:N-acetyltransferase [Microbacterium esteraromaticum]|uniref:N-acetyltransferase n=1 Tax=Microbacterium esteraromaticum TaxID=57043 RepID=A0A7D8AI18_9MICO|nr:GNAT family N-acetyltransferase [Microbacterium esteraromaticum]QMU98022.1 N-acetyltransferase [Microbacterium esteraromaticum]
MTDGRFVVRDLPGESRYVLIDRGEDGTQSKEIGEESYVDVGDERVLFHTGVAEEYGGQGLASTLVRAVVDDSVAAGRSIVPVCPYVAAWLPKHPEYQQHVVERRGEHIAAIKAQQG